MKEGINFNEALGLKNIKVLGYTTDFNQCECCGKENLKGTVSILDMQHDVVLHFGTTCAAAADKYDTLDAVKAVKREINRVVNEYKELEMYSASLARRRLKEVLGHSNYSPEVHSILASQILAIRLSGNKFGQILLDGQPIPKGLRLDLDEAGLCTRLPVPKI